MAQLKSLGQQSISDNGEDMCGCKVADSTWCCVSDNPNHYTCAFCAVRDNLISSLSVTVVIMDILFLSKLAPCVVIVDATTVSSKFLC